MNILKHWHPVLKTGELGDSPKCITIDGNELVIFRSKDKTDLDVIRENQKFIWEDDDKVDTWEKRLAKKYYDKLFKEYCICDLTLFKQNKVAYYLCSFLIEKCYNFEK